MKITFEILGILLVVLAAYSGTMYFIQRKREQHAQAEGLVVYATLVSSEPVKFMNSVGMRKITLSIQEPDSAPREVVLRSRVDPGQKLTTGARMPVVIDPKKPTRIYPATPESAKRAVLTGSRQERRAMQSQMRNPRLRERPRTGYQPPASKLR